MKDTKLREYLGLHDSSRGLCACEESGQLADMHKRIKSLEIQYTRLLEDFFTLKEKVDDEKAM